MEKSLENGVEEGQTGLEGSRNVFEITRKIDALEGEKRMLFDKVLMENLYDRGFFDNHKDYVNPNIPMVKVKTYERMVKFGLINGENEVSDSRCTHNID